MPVWIGAGVETPSPDDVEVVVVTVVKVVGMPLVEIKEDELEVDTAATLVQ